jgi:glycosyltransferase involved in cell wall biosynthesis
LFEYLTAGPPILVIGEGSEAARIVSETETGIAAPVDDPQAVADAIARLVRGISARRRPEAVQRYSWEVLARQAGELIDEVCGSRDSSVP